MTISLSTLIERNATILTTDLDDAIVMMDVDQGAYYELDPIGARIWRLLETPGSVAEICIALTTEFGVDHQTCQQDVLNFIQSLNELDLVQPVVRAGRP